MSSLKNFSENFSSLKFNEQIAERVNVICDPLFKYFNIKNFSFARITNDGRMLRLSSDVLWTKKFFEHKFYNDFDFYIKNIQSIPKAHTKYLLLSGEPKGDHYSAIYEYGFWNIFVIFEKLEEYTNIWSFCSARDNSEMINFYLNNIDVLKHFMEFFKQFSGDLLSPGDNSIWIKSNLRIEGLIEDEDNCIVQFINETSIKKYFSSFLQNISRLSKREFECLELFSRGNTIKSTAQILSLSPRTIEKHLENIKQKTGIRYKYHLIRLFIQDLNYRDGIYSKWKHLL